jgi:hypothetical protein
MRARYVVPRRLLGLGLIGSTLLAFGGVGAGAVPKYRDAVAELLHLDWVQKDPTARSISLVVAVAGLLMLAAAWWRLRHVLDRVAPKTVLLIAGLWSLPLLLGTPLFSRDVYAYAGQGNLVLGGIDPYEYGPGALVGKWSYGVDDFWRFTPSPYGPVWLWLSGRIVALTPTHVVPSVLMFRALAVAGLLMAAWALPRLARLHGVLPQRALWLGLANPFVLLHGVGGAHNDTLMVGLLLVGLAIASERQTVRRFAAAAFLITVAALIKLPAVAALGFLPMLLPDWRGRLRAGLLILGVAATTAVGLTAATGLGWGWLRTLSGNDGPRSIFSPLTGVGVLLDNALQGMGIVHDGDGTAVVVYGGLALAGLLSLTLLLRAHHLGPLRALGLTMVVVVALAPIVQPWYLMWGLVLLAAVGGERVIVGLGALSVVLCLTLLPNGRSLIRPPFYGVPLLAAIAFAVWEVRRSAEVVLHESAPVPAREPDPEPATPV